MKIILCEHSLRGSCQSDIHGRNSSIAHNVQHVTPLTCPVAFTLVQHPLICPELSMEPQGVVKRGHKLHLKLKMGKQCRTQERVV